MKGRVDLASRVGDVEFPNPVLTASGTAGHGAELAAFFDLSTLGAVVVKSLSAEAWAGNPAPRVHETEAGMLNSVGLQNPGVEAWLAEELPALVATGARVVASIWGTTVAGYEKAAAALAAAAPPSVVAVEVNLSCPNLEGGRHMFATDPSATREAMAAVVAALGGRPAWAKLSPNVTDIVEIAVAAGEGGASALTLVNTVKGLAIDPLTRRARLGAGGGGLSGAAIRPVAVRAIFDVHQALPAMPLVGVGGVATGEHAVELLLAGASAVQVGTATFEDPRACVRVLAGLEAWCRRHRVARVADLVGQAHGAS
ncbi:MAG: dihydroorotate dehydrogenase catalytic subunit [Actinomycetota bacterium]|nr:dihydroorotate dehydrogenase catalytic subunit [Actinomycetota bacterium]